MQTISRPDNRLLSAVSYLTQGGKCIDVGTDHAYLPIYLVQEGIVDRAMAKDFSWVTSARKYEELYDRVLGW